MSEEFDSRFVEDNMPDARLVAYTCAGCGAVYKRKMSINNDKYRDGLPSELREISVAIWDSKDTGSGSRTALVPVCDNPVCVDAGARAAFELLVDDKKACVAGEEKDRCQTTQP